MINQALVRELRRTVERNRALGQNAHLNTAPAGGVFEYNINGGPWHAFPNLLPIQGRNFILDCSLGSTSKQTNWYMAPFAANVAPTDSLTAANFTSTQTEFTNYTETTRALWTPSSSASGVVSNAATPVSITVGSGSQFSMYGLGLLSASAKSATTGVLAACVLFTNATTGDPQPRTGLVTGDVIGLRYTITLSNPA